MYDIMSNMNNKGFSTILGIVLGLVIIGGGAYLFYGYGNTTTPENPSTEETENIISEDGVTAEEERVVPKTETVTTKQESNKIIDSFYFTRNNASILHPVTKAIVEKNFSIANSDLRTQDRIALNTGSDLLLEIDFQGCAVVQSDTNWYVLKSKNSDNFLVAMFDKDIPDANSIIRSIKENESTILSKGEAKVEMKVEGPPVDIVSDGYYYALFEGFNIAKNEIKIDFASIDTSTNQMVFDVLMHQTSGTVGYSANISLENNNINKRTFKLSGDINVDGLNYLTDNFPSGSGNMLIYIMDGFVNKIIPIRYPC